MPGDHLTIYASLPFLGPSGASGEAALGGARMALAAVGGRIGRYRITLRTLNDAIAARGGWDPGQTSANARLAIQDRSTIAYLGDLNSGPPPSRSRCSARPACRRSAPPAPPSA